jgi:hypothetical protein
MMSTCFIAISRFGTQGFSSLKARNDSRNFTPWVWCTDPELETWPLFAFAPYATAGEM